MTSISDHAVLQVELIGRVQKQEVDQQYYTCVCYVKVVGSPVYGFLPKGWSTAQSAEAAPETLGSPYAADSATTSVSSALYHRLQSAIGFNAPSEPEACPAPPTDQAAAEAQCRSSADQSQPCQQQQGKFHLS